MLHYFIIHKHDNSNENIVHKEQCKALPHLSELNYLGMFSTPTDAMNEAKERFVDINACKFCLPHYYSRNSK